MTDYTVAQAKQRLLDEHTWPEGECDYLGGWIWTGGASGYTSAAVHAETLRAKGLLHPWPADTSQVPDMADVLFEGGSHGYGHRATWVNGRLYSTDEENDHYSPGNVSYASIADIEAWGYGQHVVGWANPYYFGRQIADLTIKEAPMTVVYPVTFVDSALNFEANKWTLADCDTFIANVKKAGHSGFFYYISREPSKCMPRWAILRCLTGGLVGAGIFEDTADNPKGGATQGQEDAAFVLQYQKNLGAPAGMTVLNAFDRNTYNPVPGSPELAYAEAFAGDIKAHYLPGGYGDRAVCDLACHEVKMLVQTWTHTGTAGVHIVQLVTNVIRKVSVPECDTDQIVHNFPTWKAVPVAPAVKPVPALPQTHVHAYNALRELAMVPTAENAARLSHIHAAQAHLKESIA